MLPKPGRYANLYEGIYIPGDRIDDMINAADKEEHKKVFTMILKWGLRLDEALNMTTDQIDAKNARIIVRGKGQGKERKVRPVWVDRKSLEYILSSLGYKQDKISGLRSLGKKRQVVNVSRRSIQYAWKKAAKKIRKYYAAETNL